MKFRKKPVVIDAIQWTGDNFQSDFIPLVMVAFEKSGLAENYTLYPTNDLVIHTLEGDVHASIGDWIIVGVKGEMYPCKPDVFSLTYELE
jgi:hypothetical protein